MTLSLDGEERRRVAADVRFIVGSGVPVNGTSGTGAGDTGPGSLYFDITNSVVYINTNTKLSPTWVSLVANLTAGSVTTAILADLAVSTAKLAALSVTNAKLGLLSVATGNIQDLAVTAAKIAANTITAAEIAASAVDTSELTDLGVTTAKLAANAVTAGKCATSLIQQATGTITSADITGTAAGQFGHANGYPLIAAPGAHNIIELISAIAIYDYSTAAYGAGGNITVNRGAGAGALTGLISAANFCGAAADKIAQWNSLTTAAINLTENEGVNLVSSAAFTQPGTAAGVIRFVVTYRIHATAL